MNRKKLANYFTVGLLALAMSATAQRVLYIGDSITDGGWGRPAHGSWANDPRVRVDPNNCYGQGYVMLCAAHYTSWRPSQDWAFWNRGITGNDIKMLSKRWGRDALDLRPDIISILIGTNDVGYYERDQKKSGKEFTVKDFDFEGWERTYRHLMDTTRQTLPQTKMVLCTPFVGKEKGEVRKAITDSLAQIVRGIAKDYGALVVPFDKLFAKLETQGPSPSYWIWDGVHPTAAGHEHMAKLWQTVASPLMRAGEHTVK